MTFKETLTKVFARELAKDNIRLEEAREMGKHHKRIRPIIGELLCTYPTSFNVENIAEILGCKAGDQWNVRKKSHKAFINKTRGFKG